MNFIECFLVALRLGLTAFGGPVAHLAYFREAYVDRMKWLSDEKYAELLAVCQFMPGPASSQLGAAIGFHRGGWLGGLGAWLGFTLPSAIILILLASNLEVLNDWVGSGWIHGLKVVAVAVVAVAIHGMGQKLCPDVVTMVIALAVAGILLFFPYGWLQPLLIISFGMLGAFLFSAEKSSRKDEANALKKFPMCSVIGLAIFVVSVMVLSLVHVQGADAVMARGLIKTGSLVFGGGHVVLPLLEAETVGRGIMVQDDFLAGYGAAQAVPGPMFTLSAFLGAKLPLFGSAWLGGFVAVVCIFLPGMVLLALGMPLWNRFKDNQRVKGGLKGANATVVGLLIAALVHIIRHGALASWIDIVLALVLIGILLSKKIPVWMIVISGAVIGGFVS